MKNSRFTELLSGLKFEQYERFSDFIQSPFFNKNVRAIKIWNYINSVRKNDGGYSKMEISRAAFGDEEFSGANFRMLISDFVKLIERFFLMVELEKDVSEMDFKLMEMSQNMRMRKCYSKYKRKCGEYIEKQVLKNTEFYYRQYLLESIKLIVGDGGDLNLADDAITNALICSKLENAVIQQSNKSKTLPLMKELIAFVKKNEKLYKKMHPLIFERMIELNKTLK